MKLKNLLNNVDYELISGSINSKINDITYDYETGYKYYGKIINKDLINEFKQNLYDDSETIEVAFYGSEVIKILSNAENKEMEI